MCVYIELVFGVHDSVKPSYYSVIYYFRSAVYRDIGGLFSTDTSDHDNIRVALLAALQYILNRAQNVYCHCEENL